MTLKKQQDAIVEHPGRSRRAIIQRTLLLAAMALKRILQKKECLKVNSHEIEVHILEWVVRCSEEL